MPVYKIEIDPNGNMDKFQEAMMFIADEQVLYTRKLAEEIGVSGDCATNIVYLRTRSRWTQNAEDELIRMDKAGEPAPNIMEWP